MEPNPPSSAPNQQNGINIKDALSILSDRAKGGGDNISSESNSVPDELKGMGQQIDISDQMDFAKLKCGCSLRENEGDSTTDQSAQKMEDDETHKAMKEARAKRAAEIQKKIECMSLSDMLGAIFGAQQERVATYKMFEEGLATILKSGNITNYPVLCAKVTASFSVLSDTINAVKSSVLNKHKRKDIGDIITQLQKYESEKLNLTAALHLEQLRLKNSELGVGVDGSDEGTVRLLQQGVSSLKHKVSRSVEQINEMIDELRCIAADEME